MVRNGTKFIFAECTPVEPGTRTGTAYGHREPLARNPCPPGTGVVQWCLPVRKQQVGRDAACNATENGERTPASTVATATIAQRRRIQTTNRTTSHADVITRPGVPWPGIPAQTPQNHYFCGFDQSGGSLSRFQLHFARGAALIIDVIC